MLRDWRAEEEARRDDARDAADRYDEARAEAERDLGTGVIRRMHGGREGGPGRAVRDRAAERARQLEIENRARRAVMDADPTYTPEYTYEDLYDAGPSAFSDVSADPYSVEAQRRALDMMRTAAETRGFTPAESAMMQQSLRQAEQSQRSQRQADLQALEARGMGGSGLSMLSGQMAAQAGADRGADFGAQAMMAAQQRALAAMQQYGAGAAQMRGQSFGESATRAGGLDAWNQALAQRAQGVEGRNVERYNQAQDQGFANRFQREALSQGLYGMERQAEENERDRAARTREAQRDRENAMVIAGTQAAASTIGGMGGMR